MKQYISKPRTVGAILPSSKYLADKMIKNINFDDARYIVEYGPGTGTFTEKILEKRSNGTIVMLFEKNSAFCKMLEDNYKNEPNLYIINDSAENIEKYLLRYDIPWADYIVSGLPFASLPPNVSSDILSQTKKYLRPDGRFITFQYTLMLKNFIRHYFSKIDIEKEKRNIPPAYVFCCYNDVGDNISE